MDRETYLARKARRWIRNLRERVTSTYSTNQGHLSGRNTGLVNVLLECFRIALTVLNHIVLGTSLIIVTILCIPIAVGVRLVSPFVLIRVGYFDAKRMGHFAIDLGTYLVESECSNTHQKRIDLFFLRGHPANYQLAKMAKRQFLVLSIARYLWLANRLLPGSSRHQVLPAIKSVNSRDTRGLFYKQDAKLEFTEQETRIAHDFLEDIGFKPHKPFVCLNVRDSAYLESYMKGDQWDYHSYRDSDIEMYVSAALLLANRGYGVIRMGKVVANKFNVNHPLVLDYANSIYRSDFLDVWLMANCYFCISNGSGLDSISDIFRTPTVMVNFIPATHIHSWQNAITAPKRLYWDKDPHLELTLSEVLEHGYMRSERYGQHNINVVDLTPFEITEAVNEMDMRLSRSYKGTDTDIANQAKFWEIFRSGPRHLELHGFIHPDNYISNAFIRKNPNWLS